MTTDSQNPIHYRKLPGSAGIGRIHPSLIAVFYEKNGLYLGDDHLLSVNGYYEERYHRFSFRDIQGIVVQRTNTWMISAAVLGTILLILSMLAGGALWATSGKNGDDWGALFVLCMIVILPAAGVLTMHLIQGPSCRVFIKTAVQCKELPALSRWRGARKAVACLQPLIEQAQADLPPLSQAAYLLELNGGKKQASTDTAQPASSGQEPPVTEQPTTSAGTTSQETGNP